MSHPQQQGPPQQWPPQMQGQPRPLAPGYSPAVPAPGMQNMPRQMQQPYPTAGMPGKPVGGQAGSVPLNRAAPAGGPISFNVGGQAKTASQMPVNMTGQAPGQMNRMPVQPQMGPGGQMQHQMQKPMTMGQMNPAMNPAGRGIIPMTGQVGAPGAGQVAAGAQAGQPGADASAPKVMQGDGRILSKQKLQELVAYIDSEEKLDGDAEDLLMLIADEFVESVTSFACRIAKHRRSTKLEVKDLQFHLDHNWGIKVPGFGAEEDKGPVRLPMNDAHRQRLAAVKRNRSQK